MDGSFIFFFAAILIVGGLLFAVISFTKRDGKGLDVEQYRAKWLAIERQLKNGEEASYQLSVLNADKLLDAALKDAGYGGNTMGERMKAATARWSNANAVWTAHKLRNTIAHEHDAKVTYDMARRALGAFKQGLKDVGAI